MGVQYYPPDEGSIRESLDALETFEKLSAKKDQTPPIIRLEGSGAKRHLECINVSKLSWVNRTLLNAKIALSKENFATSQILDYLNKLPSTVKSEILDKMKARLQSQVAASSPKTAKVYEKTLTLLQTEIASLINDIPDAYTTDKDFSLLKNRLEELEKRGKGEPALVLARQMLEKLEQGAIPEKPLSIPPDVQRPIYKKPGEPVADVEIFLEKLMGKGKKSVDALKLELASLERRYPHDSGLEVAKDLISELERAQKPKPEAVAKASIGYGIFNAGNSCYLNATMQALRACAPFRQHLTNTPVTSPGDQFAKTLLEINRAPANVIEQFWQRMFLLQLQPEEARDAYIMQNASRFGIPKNQLLAMKEELYLFSVLSESMKKPYIKAVLHDALLRVYQDLETKPGAASRNTSQYLRLMAMAGGFGENTIALHGENAPAKQEDAAEFCEQLMNLLDFPGFVSFVDVDYKKEALGFSVTALEIRDRMPTKVLTLPINDVKAGGSIQELLNPLRVEEKIELWENSLSDWNFTPVESKRQLKALTDALTIALAEAKTEPEKEALAKILAVVRAEPGVETLAKALAEVKKEVKELAKKRIKNPTIQTIHTRQLQVPPPTLLPISLSRFFYDFQHEQSIKVDKVLHPPEVLEMHLAGDPTKRAQYKLVSGVVHTGGKSANSGHYTAYTREGAQTIHYDDNVVTPIPAETAERVISQNGYLLFYTFVGYVEAKS